MNEIFLYVSTGLILFSYVGYFVLIMYGRSKNVSKENSFDIVKDIISEYNSINVIESKSYFTIYNIKRKVVKLSSKIYYGSDLSSVSLSLIEAGISIVDKKKNKFLDILRNVFSNLKLLYIFPIIVVLINNSSFNVNDAKSSIIFVLIFTFLSYIVLDIKSQGIYFISENIKNIKVISKEGKVQIVNFMNKLLLFDKIIYFGELIVIVRIVFIMLGII